MTFRQFVLNYLTERGMFPADAEKVFAMCEQSEGMEEMRGRWTDNTEECPPSFLAVIALGVNDIATQYIDENMPRVWFRPMFEMKGG
jgi:hypothetical protein